MWLDITLMTSVAVAALAWASLSGYVLLVQRRREAARDTLQGAFATLARTKGLAVGERVEAVAPDLASASRDLVLRAAADHDVDRAAFEVLAAFLRDRWGPDALVRDGSAHRSRRERWRRITALRILTRLQHPHAINLLARALDDADDEVSEEALALLGRCLDPRAMDLLIDALRARRHPASRVAVYIDRSPQEIGPRLATLLSDANADVRQWAAAFVERYPDPAYEAQLIALTADEEPRVRKAAIQTLGMVGSDAAVEPALHRLTDPVPYVRAHAARALGRLGVTDGAERVALLLGDADWWVRLAARESLEEMGTDVWPVLVRCLEHRDRFVRNGAAEVIQNLGVLDSLVMLEAASDSPAHSKITMLRRITAAGGVRFTESLVERAGPVVGPRVRQLLSTIGMDSVGVA